MEGLFHIGLTVRNLERSLAFYRDVVGMKDSSATDGRIAPHFLLGPFP
jgi:catechol 2,3-dioxygenase-like lactoylglutathione lyase family enzyme